MEARNPFIEKAVKKRARAIMLGHVEALTKLLSRINEDEDPATYARVSTRLDEAKREMSHV